MRRVLVAGAILLAVFAVMTWISLFVVPPWAIAKIQRGDELPLPTQVVIASSHFWSRYVIFIFMAFVAAFVGWASRAVVRSPGGE